MPKIKYVDWKPRGDAKNIIAIAEEILNEYSAKGYQLTLRQLYYQYVARDLLPNTEKSYSKLGDIISNARDAGMLDWDQISDRGRTPRIRHDYGSLRSFTTRASRSFTLDLWEGQSTRVEVWVEKDALSQIVEQAAAYYGVTTFANRGYVSASAMWESAQRLLNLPGQVNSVHILHFGDHDPSGIDMTRDIEKRLTLYAGEPNQDAGQTYKEVIVTRIALTMEQVTEYEPPPNPAKVTDSRFESYRKLYGDDSWELDAIPPDDLEELVKTGIQDLCDIDALEDRREFETAEQQRLRDVANEIL